MEIIAMAKAMGAKQIQITPRVRNLSGVFNPGSIMILPNVQGEPQPLWAVGSGV